MKEFCIVGSIDSEEKIFNHMAYGKIQYNKNICLTNETLCGARSVGETELTIDNFPGQLCPKCLVVALNLLNADISAVDKNTRGW